MVVLFLAGFSVGSYYFTWIGCRIFISALGRRCRQGHIWCYCINLQLTIPATATCTSPDGQMFHTRREIFQKFLLGTFSSVQVRTHPP
ncbi:hypothetical protein GALMADRAFT_739760 [Galerina marginata CBS 339.88]|uniref:Uncharacterized protein n=1 Tax=Galerina marginata (strain CBS 339.88) TaxID=685588 RepID=A0A067SYX2_GALM3|nr:hypothetical protein GALMADRAFT_739760 [Galerina marginata CBS 339.88]